MEWITNRLNQPSTWRGVIALLTAFGVKMSPDLQETIIALGLATMGLIGVLADEHKATKAAAKQAAVTVAVNTAANVADQVAEEKAVDQSARIAELEAQIVELQRKLPLPWLPESQTPIKG